MTDRHSLRELVRQAFQNGLQTPYSPNDYHPVDDDDFLIDLSIGDVLKVKREEFINHLARCSYCRNEIAKMVHAGVLRCPDVAEREPPQPTVSPERRESPWTSSRVVFAIAASVLIAVGVGLLFLPGTSELTLARNDMIKAQYLSAVEHAETYLESAAADAPDREEARQILSDAGYRQSLDLLKKGDFDRVKELGSRVEELAGRSPRMTNLKLQAMRKQTGRSAWPDHGDLTDYGYRLNGRSYAKPLPVFDENVKAVLSEYERAVAEFPDDPDLRLNYGQFLLEQEDPEGARTQLQEAQRLTPMSAETQMALGILAFQQEQFDAAIGHFRAALNEQPDNTKAMLNLAICHARLGQNADAISWFEKVRDRLPTEERRDEIDRMTDSLKQEF